MSDTREDVAAQGREWAMAHARSIANEVRFGAYEQNVLFIAAYLQRIRSEIAEARTAEGANPHPNPTIPLQRHPDANGGVSE